MQVLVAPRAAHALAALLTADEHLVAAFEGLVADTGELFALGLTPDRLIGARFDAAPGSDDDDAAIPDASFAREFISRVHLDREGLTVTLTTGAAVQFIPLPGELAAAVGFCDAAGFPVIAPADAIEADLAAVAPAAPVAPDATVGAAPEVATAEACATDDADTSGTERSSAVRATAIGDSGYYVRLRPETIDAAAPAPVAEAPTVDAAPADAATARAHDLTGDHAPDGTDVGADDDTHSDVSVVAADETECPRCHHPASRRSVFCSNCGATID